MTDAVLFDAGAPACHPRLFGGRGARELEPLWARGVARIDDVLVPGLAAELAPFARSLPLVATAGRDPDALEWVCEFAVPPAPDPQYPPPLFALSTFVHRDLPALVGASAGADFAYGAPGQLRVSMLRKGCYVDARAAPAADGVVEFRLDLTAPGWPVEWGGHLAVAAAGGEQSMAPACGCLDLIANRRWRVPLVIRQVEGLAITGFVRRR